MSAPEPLTADQALVRLRQYHERTTTWSTATYNDGTERALARIAGALATEVERLRAVTDGPICSEEEARAAGLDVPPGVAEWLGHEESVAELRRLATEGGGRRD